MSNTRQIKVTAPPAIVKVIDEEVENGRFTGRGDFVLYAIRYYIDNHKTPATKKESED
ncbi:ribbon-helix-helix domain-containing protein [Candidatus Methanomassiliicoccus intestinalis]|jgi:hypothetical protein|uniref:Ribbon-helix-helix protein CopG domain-containing protein n=1 Tax=Methanomassiliicoccus intestinalis (strain Issoire-Mx1) TaxID=1295009 RepID=R9TAP2_METII|nr:ribbon-helix-helix domain-containing protein [Candidatus Methanomassiliicoccus intestinalis]AGN26736.1 hypothetical protein MMINT_14180 [Candidatus Methanomassiliicoccus intestinalis Issoire-Mx1]